MSDLIVNTDGSVERSEPSEPSRWRLRDGQRAALYLDPSGESVTDRTVQNWRERGLLAFVKVGKSVFYRESDLDELIARNLRPGASAQAGD